MYCCFCLTSVVPSNECSVFLPCCVDKDNHQVSVCLKPDSIASLTVSSNVLYCFVFATFKARNLPVFNPLCAFLIVCLKKFSFHESDVSNLILDCFLVHRHMLPNQSKDL